MGKKRSAVCVVGGEYLKVIKGEIPEGAEVVYESDRWPDVDREYKRLMSEELKASVEPVVVRLEDMATGLERNAPDGFVSLRRALEWLRGRLWFVIRHVEAGGLTNERWYIEEMDRINRYSVR